MTGEGSMADWSAIYMHKVVGESEAFGAIAFGIFGAAMTMGRLFGDFFTMRLGKYKLLIADSILAIFGLSIAILFPHPTVTLVGFFLVGLGLSTIVPIVYSTAGNTKGVAPSVGIAMATSIGNLGFFVGPPTIGYIADLLGLRVGLAFPVTLFLLMFIFIVLLLRSKANSSNKTPNVS
jgi:MFS family permease